MTAPGSPVRPLFPLDEPLRDRLAGSPRIVLLDIDGTLAPIAPTPEAAAVPHSTRAILTELAGHPNTTLALVTGRAAADGRAMVPGTRLWVIGNHGAEILAPDGTHEVERSVAAFGPVMENASKRIAARVGMHAGILVENKTWTLSVHYRLADPAIAPAVRREVESVAAELGLLMAEGRMVYEVKPPVRVHKGTAVVQLVNRLSADWDDERREGALLLFAGDDVTDEDAFRMLREEFPRAITIKVATEDVPTAAEFRARDPEEIGRLLEQLGPSVSASSSKPA